MKLQNESFTIDIVTVNTADVCFEDYDVVHFKENAEQELSRSHLVTIRRGNAVRSVLLVGDLLLYDEHCAILEGTILTVLQNNTLVQLDLYTGEVIRQNTIEAFGGNFQLHLTPVGYLVYGECTVATYDKDLKPLWDFSGKDIFATLSDKPAFEIGTDSMVLYDFEDNVYKLDSYGNPI